MTSTPPHPTQRFTDRAADYGRYRPGYPDEVGEVLRAEVGLRTGSVVADLASGTGISSELLLRLGCTVLAVEPNEAMRTEAERRFENEPRFRSVTGTAEATTLPGGSVRLALAAQAFHWFAPREARREFGRILEPGGWAALLWNDRRTDVGAFAEAYEGLLREFGTDYEQVRHRAGGPREPREFFDGPYQTHRFPNEQLFDFPGLRGRLLSSSYTPASGHPRCDAMLEALEAIFDTHHENGHVRLVYDTRLHLGRVATAGASGLRAE